MVADERAKTRGKSATCGALLLALAGALLGASVPALAGSDLCQDGTTTLNTASSGTGCGLDKSNDKLIVGAAGAIENSGSGNPAVWIHSYSGPVTGIQLDNAGTINAADADAIFISGLAGNSLQVDSLVNQAGGTISGAQSGIGVDSSNGSVTIGNITNGGTLSGHETGLNIAGNAHAITIGSIVNQTGALIQGDYGAINISGYDNGTLNLPVTVASIENFGTLRAGGGHLYALRLVNVDLTGQLSNQMGGLIDGAEGGIGIELSTTGAILNAGTIKSGEYFNGVDLDRSTVTGNLTNSGVIESKSQGIYLSESTITGDLINQGTITSMPTEGSVGPSAILLEHSTLNGSLNNSGTLHASQGTGLSITNSHLASLENSGTISGIFGVAVVDNSSLGAINNSGTLHGDLFALVIDGSGPVAINIMGKAARLEGDVLATDSTFTLKTGAEFANSNAIKVDAFVIEQGATLQMGTGTTLGSALDTSLVDGITVGAGGFTNHGTLALGATTTAALHGDYVQAADGTLKIGVTNDNTFGKLVVDGAATLASNAKINVDVSNPNYRFQSNQLQGVLSATTLNSDGTFAVTDNSRLFDFGAVKNGNTVDLTLRAASGSTPSVEQIVTTQGNNPASPAARALDQSFARNPDSALAAHFVGLTGDQQVSDAVTQSMPLLTGASMGATTNAMSSVNRVVQARQDSNSGLSSGDSSLQEEHLWIKPFGSWADQNERNGVAGFDANTYGLAIGADAAVSEAARLGVAFAYAHTDVDSRSSIAPQSLKVETFQLIGYASYNLQPDTEINAQLDIGQHNNEGKREMPFANTTARSDYSSYSAHAGLGLGHTLRFSNTLTFVPSVRADYTWLGDPSYHEKGAGALDLKVDSRDAEELVFALDGKLNYLVASNTVLSANIGAGYDVINEQTSITSLYAGDPSAGFTSRGADPSPWRARAGLGLTHSLANGTEVSLRYDAESRSDFLNQGASVKARWAF